MRPYSRYQQSPTQSHLDLKPRQPLNPRASFSGSTPKNPELQLLHLPALTMRRSSSNLGTDRNTKFRLQNLQQKLQQLSAEVRNTRLDAQETLNTIRFLKQSLAVNQLGKTRQDLKKQIKGFERIVTAGRIADEERNAVIRKDCSELWTTTETLRQTLFELRMRTQQLDRSMGFQKNQS